MASGDSPPQKQSLWSRLFCGASTLYQSVGFGNQEESEKCDRDTDTVEMSSTQDHGESRNQQGTENHSCTVVSDLEKDALESKILSTQVTNLLAEKKELNDKLEERDRRILALREESNVIVRKNHDLEAKFGHQPKSKTRDFVKTLSDQAQKMKDLQAHIEMQSRAIVNLKDEHNSERSAEIARYQEVEDERDRLKEDFQSARETIDQLRNKISASRHLPSLPDIQMNCDNSSCIHLQKESSLLEQELAATRLSISSLEKAMEQMRKDRDAALDEYAVANIKAETFKSDFEAERKDRERAQGLLDGFKNKGSATKVYEKAIVDLQKQLRAVNQELMESKRKLSDTAVELKKSKSSSSEAVMGQFKCTIEDLTHERDHYYQECERSKFLLSDMKKIETELKSKKNFVKQLRKEVENKTKEITSLNGTVRRKDRELAKAKQEIISGNQAKVKLVEADLKIKAVNKELLKFKPKGESTTKRNKKAIFQRGSKTEVKSSETDSVILEDQAQHESLEFEIRNLKSDLEDQKYLNDELKRLLVEMTEYSGVPMMDEETKTAASGVNALGYHQNISRQETVAPSPQCIDHDVETKLSNSSKSQLQDQKPTLPPRRKKSTGSVESNNSPKFVGNCDKHSDPHVRPVSTKSQESSYSAMPSLESCGTATGTSHSASAVNFPLRAGAQQPPLHTSWEDQARPNYGDLGNSERSAMQSSDTAMDSFRHSQMPTRARHDESYIPEPAHYKVPMNDQQYDYPFRAGREIASNRMEGLSPSKCYPSAENYQASFSGHQSPLPSGNPVQNPPSSHNSSRGVVGIDRQQYLAANGGGTQGTQNLPPQVPRKEEHSYKQGFQIEQQQKYKSEEILGKKSSHSDPSESSQSLPDPFYSLDTADTIPEGPKRLAHGTNPPGYLVTNKEKAAIVGDKVKVVGGDSHAVAESSSEGSNGDQLHKDIDEEIHRFAEHVNEQVNPDFNRQVTQVQLPLDPNLICPICHKNFRIGQIQKFKKHVDSCF